ncbi:transglutaminaseTgpA domain-containing protein [Nocardioides sp. QY071]|uniref:DUF3488 and transglutaminase-like domain-containing protein n=1 Tax=Nocardioides sp. QY071 TaxID=3044187 RepID=UPI00249C31C1|nr:transglutaminaseTgpA domain-containing protein [Nocardioides sp. QY071]WGY00096.1 transglutaminaseTgpA domain-containing protein [Nocardioides sp. QY071]
MTGPRGFRTPLVEGVLPVVLLVLGTLTLATAWQGVLAFTLLALAAVLPYALLRAVVGVGVSRWAAATVLVLLMLLAAYVLTAGADLSFREMLRDLVPRLLTSPRPYALRGDLLVGPMLLTGLVSLLVGLRARSRLRVEPLVGAAVLYLAGLLLTGGTADRWGLVAAALLVTAVLGWTVVDDQGEPVRPRVRVGAPLAALGVVALAASALVAVDDPFEPRDLVAPPIVEVAASNPLTQLGAWAAHPDESLLQVRGDRVPLRLVVLDDYDGTQWTAATRYQPFDTGGTTPLPRGRVERSASQQVRITGLRGPWLPTPGQPSTVSDPAILVDVPTGTLARPEGHDAKEYAVTGSIDAPDEAVLVAAAVPQDAAALRYTRLPPLPAGIRQYCSQIAGTASTPYQLALTIEDTIRTGSRLSYDAISGSALWRLDAFLVGREGRSGAREGTSEQFASAFAVVARCLGLPSRVVVGFRPGTDQPDGSRLVTGKDAFAWPEVYFEGHGWLPFSPLPDDDTFSHDPPPQPVETKERRPEDDPTPPADAPKGPKDAAPNPDHTDPAVSAGSPWLLGTLGGVVLAVPLLLLVARRVRSARHRRRGAIGAWTEVTDALRLSGIRPPAGQPASEIAHDVDTRLGTTTTRVVARAAERAAYAPVPAGDARKEVPAEVPAAVREVRRAVRRVRPRWRRWWWHLDPRVWRR